MKILSVSGILPVPGLIVSNDFVFETARSYLRQFPSDEITIIRPTQYKTNIRKILTGKTDLKLIGRKDKLDIYNFSVWVFSFLSARKVRDLHALLAFTIILFNRRKIKKILDSHHFDVVHAQYIYPDAVLAWYIHKKYRIPYVVTTHKELYYFKFPVSRFIAKILLRNAFRILPINHMNRKYFETMGLKNIEVLPLGFNSSFIRDQKKPAKDLIRIITVSSLLPYKNIKSILYALSRLVQKYRISYTIVGNGPEMGNLQEIVQTNNLQDHVRFIEHIPHEEIADEIFRNDIFILTSYVETFGRVYFEAMAMGIPIICSENSGIWGYYKEMEEGISVVHNDPDDIAANLEKLITNQDLRLKIGIQGQQLVKNYTWDNIARRIHEIYVEMVARKA